MAQYESFIEWICVDHRFVSEEQTQDPLAPIQLLKMKDPMGKALFNRNITEIMLLAALSRVLYMAAAYTTYKLIPPYDKSMELTGSRSCLRFLLAWDSIHFLEIMENGYRKTHETAFFPLLPYASWCINKILPLEPFTVGVIVACTAFVLNSGLLYIITVARYGHQIAKMSCILFIFNPASIVYTSMYSEPLFMLLFLLGFYFVECNNMFRGTILMSLCGLCRSNGILFAPFVVFPFSKHTLVRVGIVALPAALFQYYSLLMINRAQNTFRVFIPYSYVQRVYWGQGLFKFYKLDSGTLQNMYVGFPFILMSFYILYIYWNRKKESYEGDILKDKSRLAAAILNTNMCAVILAIQTLLAVFIIHWNMYFRFISFNPIIYWVLATEHHAIKNRYLRWLIYRYYFGFGVIYAMLFGCFYPPC